MNIIGVIFNMEINNKSDFSFRCLICNNKFKGRFSFFRENCTHFYMLNNDNNSYCQPICLECGDPLFHKLPDGKIVLFERATKPIFIDANDLEVSLQ